MAAPSISGAAVIVSLYRSVLRVHKHKLPPLLRTMGDKYAREEFRRHKEGKTTNEQWGEFYIEWTKYVGTLTGNSGEPTSGDISPEVFDRLSSEQLQQLAALRQEAVKLRGKIAPGDDQS